MIFIVILFSHRRSNLGDALQSQLNNTEKSIDFFRTDSHGLLIFSVIIIGNTVRNTYYKDRLGKHALQTHDILASKNKLYMKLYFSGSIMIEYRAYDLNF